MVEDEKVESFIHEHIGCSFVEIERFFEQNKWLRESPDGMEFSLATTELGKRNIIFWATKNEELADCIGRLMTSKRILIRPCPVLTYGLDGKILGFPIATRLMQYKTTHWLPVVVNTIGYIAVEGYLQRKYGTK